MDLLKPRRWLPQGPHSGPPRALPSATAGMEPAEHRPSLPLGLSRGHPRNVSGIAPTLRCGLPHVSGIAPDLIGGRRAPIGGFRSHAAFSTVPIKKGRAQIAVVGLKGIYRERGSRIIAVDLSRYIAFTHGPPQPSAREHIFEPANGALIVVSGLRGCLICRRRRDFPVIRRSMSFYLLYPQFRVFPGVRSLCARDAIRSKNVTYRERASRCPRKMKAIYREWRCWAGSAPVGVLRIRSGQQILQGEWT